MSNNPNQQNQPLSNNLGASQAFATPNTMNGYMYPQAYNGISGGANNPPSFQTTGGGGGNFGGSIFNTQGASGTPGGPSGAPIQGVGGQAPGVMPMNYPNTPAYNGGGNNPFPAPTPASGPQGGTPAQNGGGNNPWPAPKPAQGGGMNPGGMWGGSSGSQGYGQPWAQALQSAFGGIFGNQGSKGAPQASQQGTLPQIVGQLGPNTNA